MRVLIVGATGRTGRAAVAAAVAAGHEVRAFARSAAQTAWPAGVTAWPGDACDPAAVTAAVTGVDAVIVALSMVRASDWPWARILTPLDLHTRAARALTAACARAGVRRYLTLSAHGVGDAAPRAGWAFLALVRASNIGVAYDELGRAEAVVAASGLDWTIVRPTRLTQAPGTGRWRADPQLVTTSWDRIPRDDVAAYLVQALTATDAVGERVSLTGA